MNKYISDNTIDQDSFYKLLDKYRHDKEFEIANGLFKGKIDTSDLINYITKLEAEIFVYYRMIENGEENINDYILSDIMGGTIDAESNAFKKYVFNEHDMEG